MSEYPYVDEEGWVWFNEECIVEQFVETKWNSRNKKKYVSLGYKYTKMGDVIRLDIRDLTIKSPSRVIVKCPFCNDERDIQYSDVTKMGRTICVPCTGNNRIKDLMGQTFTKLYVIDQATNHDPIKWLCRCKCGNTVEVEGRLLKSGNTKSCGCLRIDDIKDNIYGRLKVKEFVTSIKGDAVWLCKCDCGNMKEIPAMRLKAGITKSCGCLARELASKRLKDRSGEKHYNYNHDLTDAEREIGRNYPEIKQWSKDIKELNNYTCQSCGQKGYDLESHHLNNYSDFPDQRLDLENGVTLCKNCHYDFHRWMGGNQVKCVRDDFIEFCEIEYPNGLFLENI